MLIGLDGRAIGSYPGLGRYALCLLKALARSQEGHRYRVLVPSNLTAPPFEDPRFTWVPTAAPLLTIQNFVKTPWRHFFKGLDLFHALFQVASRGGPAPLVLTVHDLMDLHYPHAYDHHPLPQRLALRAYFQYGIRSSLRRAARVIAVSEETQSDLIHLNPECFSKTSVVYEGAGERFFEPVSALRLEEVRGKYRLPAKFLLSLGSTKRYKNLEGLVEGYATHLMSGGQPMPLVLAGMKGVAAPKLDTLIVSGPWRDSIYRIGPVEEEDLPAVYRLATVFCFVSVWEGFGLPALEAMACGTTVLAGNRSAVREVVGKAGVLVDPLDPHEIAGGLTLLLKDEALRYDLGRKGQERARSFTWDKTAEQTLAVYKQAVGPS